MRVIIVSFFKSHFLIVYFSCLLILFTDCFIQLLSCVRFFATPWTAACQASLSFSISLRLLKLMSIKSVMPSNHLIFYQPLLFLPSNFPSIRVFSNKLTLHGTSQFSFQSQREMTKNVQTIAHLCSFHMLGRLCSKFFNLGFNSKLRTCRCKSWI